MSARVHGPVVVGIDGSADALRALGLAGDIARGLHTPLVVVHAVGLTSIVDGRHVPSEDHYDEIAEQFTHWCRSLDTAALEDWRPMLRHGEPVATILGIVRETGAALVVVGRHGAGKRPELLLGSTAHQIAERCPCPTLIVPPLARVEQPVG